MTSAAAILKRFPTLYRLAFGVVMRFRAILDLPRYLWCRWTRRVYVGPVMSGRQTWAERIPHMQELLRRELEASPSAVFRVLEIGSWAGQSAMLWAEEIRRSGRQGRVYCVDPWMPFASPDQTGINNALSLMSRVAQRDQIFPLFWHNIRAAKLTSIVIPIRCRSADVLPVIAPNSFDLVFVDGSHVYSDFRRDLEMSLPLVREGGIICGDDLELQASEVDPDYARANCERDFLTDPHTNREYHPGVTVGLYDVFGRDVSCRDGFWAQRKSQGGWSDTLEA